MTPRQIELVRTSFATVEPIADTAASMFYGRLFDLDPALRALFATDMSAQRRNLMQTLTVVVRSLDRLETKGLVRSRAGEPTPERGGRGKRLFRVTALGRRSMTEAQRVLARMLDGLNPLESFS